MTETSNVTGFKKISSHPDKEEIVQKLLAGYSVKEVEAWTKKKYPHNNKLHVSYMSLQSYRKNYLKIDEKVIKDLQEQRKQMMIIRRRETEQEVVENSRSYQAGLANYVQDSLIDYNVEIKRLMEECLDGISQLKDLNIKKNSHLNHQAITSYLTKYQDVISMHSKMIKEQEKKVGNQIHADYAELQSKLTIMADCVKQAFSETNPEGLLVFTNLLKEKLTEAGLSF